MSEQDLVNQLLTYLRLKKCKVWRQNQGGMYDAKRRFVRFCSQPGISDIVGVLPNGRFIAVEAKVSGKKPQPHQKAFLDSINAIGGFAVCIHSLDEMQSALANEGI